MPQRSLRVIQVPFDLGNDGTAPEELLHTCNELKQYVLNYRLPKKLQGLSLWVEPRLQNVDGELRLSLLLIHDGQIPLSFQSGDHVSVDIAISTELDNLAATIEDAIAASNGVWELAAEIANTEDDPGDEVEQLRWTTGYPALTRPRAACVPTVLQIMTRQGSLALESPLAAPEYVESQEIEVTAKPIVKEGSLHASVQSTGPAVGGEGYLSRVHERSTLRLRWPAEETYAWRMIASIASLVEMPMDLVGRGVISLHTLDGKAFEVNTLRNSQAIVDKLLEIIAPVLEKQP